MLQAGSGKDEEREDGQNKKKQSVFNLNRDK